MLKSRLNEAFMEAQMTNKQYVAVKIHNNTCFGSEIIINPSINFTEKLEYYNSAYDDNLVLKACSNIAITDVIFTDKFSEIQEAFKDDYM